MRAAGHVIDEERLVWRGCVQIPHVPNSVVRQVSGEVVAGMSDPRVDLRMITEQIRLPLIGLPAQVAVEILKAHTRRPLIEGPGGAAVLKTGCVMVLPKPRRSVAVLFQDLADSGALRTDDGVIARVAGGQFADDA